MSTEKPVVKKRTYKRRAQKAIVLPGKATPKATPKATTKIKSTIAPRKDTAIPVLKTVITISPDGVITISKSEETVTEQVMSRAE